MKLKDGEAAVNAASPVGQGRTVRLLSQGSQRDASGGSGTAQE